MYEYVSFSWVGRLFLACFILSLMNGGYYTLNFCLYALDMAKRVIEEVFAEIGHGDVL